tara:strand:+ start:86 stop:328 length:243 start_codon:yes stop_codon:yes gene_type:complete
MEILEIEDNKIIRVEHEFLIKDIIDEFSSTRHFANIEFDKLKKSNPTIKFELIDYDSDGPDLFICCKIEGELIDIIDKLI